MNYKGEEILSGISISKIICPTIGTDYLPEFFMYTISKIEPARDLYGYNFSACMAPAFNEKIFCLNNHDEGIVLMYASFKNREVSWQKIKNARNVILKIPNMPNNVESVENG